MSRHVTRMTIYDAFHYSDRDRKAVISSYPKHVREARAMGKPSIGEGAIYPIEDEAIVVAPFQIPTWWLELGGLDFGYDHPTAAGRLVLDPETKIFYWTQEYRRSKLTPIQHVSVLKAWDVAFAWGSEGRQTKLSENPEETQMIFRKHGLKMLQEHATFREGGLGVERGVTEIFELMMAGQFKIFSTCRYTLEEKSTYHRKRKKDGAIAEIVKVNDDLMDAMRYCYMMFRHARPVSWRNQYGGRPKPQSNPMSRSDPRDIFLNRR